MGTVKQQGTSQTYSSLDSSVYSAGELAFLEVFMLMYIVGRLRSQDRDSN